MKFCSIAFGVMLLTLYSNAQSLSAIYFASGSDAITKSEIPKLDSAVLLLNSNPKLAVHLESRTDSIGDIGFNQKLSDRRAKSVEKYLIDKGINANRIDFKSMGELAKIADNQTDEGRQENRSVRISFFKSKPIVLSKDSLLFEGKIVDEVGLPIVAKITVRSQAFVDSTTSEVDGTYSMVIPKDQKMKVTAMAKGKMFGARWIESNSSFTNFLTFALPSLKKKMKVNMPDFHFFGGKAILLPQSEPEVKTLYQLLNDNPTLKIAIYGHINVPNSPTISKKDPDFKLSVDRAEKIKGLMEEKGIAPSRMTSAGFGNSKMIFPKATTEQEQQMNRRVEIVVTEYL